MISGRSGNDDAETPHSPPARPGAHPISENGFRFSSLGLIKLLNSPFLSLLHRFHPRKWLSFAFRVFKIKPISFRTQSVPLIVLLYPIHQYGYPFHRQFLRLRRPKLSLHRRFPSRFLPFPVSPRMLAPVSFPFRQTKIRRRPIPSSYLPRHRRSRPPPPAVDHVFDPSC